MEQETARHHIATLTEAYSALSGLKSTTILARAANDARFLERTADGDKTFTFRLYETAVRWFSAHWPEGAEWPSDVPRPARVESVEPAT